MWTARELPGRSRQTSQTTKDRGSDMIQIHPYLASQLASERQREMVAHAQQQRLARRLAALTNTSRQTRKAGRRARRALRTAARLRTEPGH
jgi:hypothetical protein